MKKYSITFQQWLLFGVATLLWISVKIGQFMIRTLAGTLTNQGAYVATIVGISGLMGVLMRLPLGVYSDYIKRKTLVIKLTLLIMVVSGAIFLIKKEAVYLLAYNLSMGILISTWVLFNVLFTKHSKPDQTIKSVGLLAISNNIGSFVAPLIVSRLVTKETIQSSTHILFAISVGVTALCLSFLLKDVSYNANQKPKILKTIKQMVDLKLWLLSIVGLSVTFKKYATLKFSFEKVVLSINGGINSVASIDASYDLLHAIAGVIAGMILVKYIGKVKTMILGVVIMGMSFILSYYASSLNQFLLFNLGAGFGMGLTYITAMGMAIENSSYEYKNTRMGLFQSVYMLGVYFAPQTSTFIEKIMDGRSVYLMCAILSVITTAVLIIFKEVIGGNDQDENKFNNA